MAKMGRPLVEFWSAPIGNRPIVGKVRTALVGCQADLIVIIAGVPSPIRHVSLAMPFSVSFRLHVARCRGRRGVRRLHRPLPIAISTQRRIEFRFDFRTETMLANFEHGCTFYDFQPGKDKRWECGQQKESIQDSRVNPRILEVPGDAFLVCTELSRFLRFAGSA